MITDTIYATLQATFSARLYPVQAPDSPTVPYAVFFVVTAPPENNLDGFAGLTNTQIQLDVYARSYEAAKALAQAAFDAMEASAMQQVCTETGRDLYESDTKLHRQLLEFSIWHGVEASVDTIIGEESATGEILMESGEEMELEVQP